MKKISAGTWLIFIVLLFSASVLLQGLYLAPPLERYNSLLRGITFGVWIIIAGWWIFRYRKNHQIAAFFINVLLFISAIQAASALCTFAFLAPSCTQKELSAERMQYFCYTPGITSDPGSTDIFEGYKGSPFMYPTGKWN